MHFNDDGRPLEERRSATDIADTSDPKPGRFSEERAALHRIDTRRDAFSWRGLEIHRWKTKAPTLASAPDRATDYQIRVPEKSGGLPKTSRSRNQLTNV